MPSKKDPVQDAVNMFNGIIPGMGDKMRDHIERDHKAFKALPKEDKAILLGEAPLKLKYADGTSEELWAPKEEE
jgi:hypothetical protein